MTKAAFLFLFLSKPNGVFDMTPLKTKGFQTGRMETFTNQL